LFTLFYFVLKHVLLAKPGAGKTV